MERDGAMGTFLILKSDLVPSQLWRDDLSFFAASADKEAYFAEAARADDK
jgi:hypothetical protein